MESSKRGSLSKGRIIGRMLTVLIILLIIALFLIRLFSPRHLDDVSPERYCPKSLVEKSDILFVIPISNNISVADNRSWCEYILSLNKTIAMHGVYHVPDIPGEFAINRDKEYIQRGMEEFKKCFGFYPSLFKAPECKLSKQNEKLLKEMNLTIISTADMLFYKEYHCIDQEHKSYLVELNRFMSWF